MIVTDDPVVRATTFLAEVLERLKAGRKTYGDRSFGASPPALLAELEQEALDLAGWGFILWERIRRMREACEVIAPAPVRLALLIWQPAAHRFQIGCAIELPRIPVARELIELPEPPCGERCYEPGSYRVRLVKHTPGASGGAVAADLYLEPVESTLAAATVRAAVEGSAE